MTSIEIISLVVTIVCLISFCVVFTILIRHYFKSNIENIVNGKEDIAILDNAIYTQKENKSKARKGLKISLKVFSYIFIGVLLAGFGISLYSRISGNQMVFDDSTLIVIASGSMSTKNNSNSYLVENNLDNQFNTFDIIGVSKYKTQDDVKLYDVVAYKNSENTIIVHRITEIVEVDGIKKYNTRGDSNNASDNNSQYYGYLSYDSIVGYYNNYRIQTAGIFIVFLQSNAGIITIVSIIYCLLIYDRHNLKYEQAIKNRTDILLSALDFDPNVPMEEEPEIIFKETLIYKGFEYHFENNVFKDKISLDEKISDNQEKYDKDKMVVIKEVDGIKEVKIDNINNKK